MKKNYFTAFITLVALAILLGAIIFIVDGQQSLSVDNSSDKFSDSARTAGTLSVSEPFFDFGAISMAAGNVSRVSKIKNSGNNPLRIKKIYTSCMCTTATLDNTGVKQGPFGMPGHGGFPSSLNETIEPNQEAEITVVYDPAAHGPAGVGKVRRVIYIETDAEEKPFELSFEATVTP
ncbi:MAG: DUF1573 domain-containing protein [Patescibacteria group bacterium]